MSARNGVKDTQFLWTDDKYRPLDEDGNVVAPVPKDMNIWYMSPQGDINQKTEVKWYLGFTAFAEGQTQSGDVELTYVLDTALTCAKWKEFLAFARVLVEFSADNFQTILARSAYKFPYYTSSQHSTVDDTKDYCTFIYSDGYPFSWVYYNKYEGYNSSMYVTERAAHCHVGAPYDPVILPPNSDIQIRFTLQSKRDDGDWGTTSGDKPIGGQQIFYMHTPVLRELDAVYPNTVYMNRLNQFGLHIDGEYLTTFDVTQLVGQRKSYTNIANRPVRNETYPYIEIGEDTETIYWFPNVFNEEAGTDGTGRDNSADYTLQCVFGVPASDDPKFYVPGIIGTISGTAVWAEQDDTSICTVSYHIIDAPSSITKYGKILRNVNQTLRFIITYTVRYGVSATYQYIPFKSGSWNNLFYQDQESKTYEYTVTVPSGKETTLTHYHKFSFRYRTVFDEELTYPVIDYSYPAYANLSVNRCNSAGSDDDNGEYCRIEWSTVIMPINNQNSKKLVIEHSAGKTEYDPLDNYIQSGVLIVEASTERSYNIVFSLSDDFTTVKRTLLLGTAGVIMDCLYGGKGVSFGKVSSRQYTVEISERWQLLCYKLMLSGVDVQKWMTDVAARIKGLEQYTRNLTQTSQFQVTFYNGNDIVDRQWIVKARDAMDPNIVPEKAPTESETYSFAGWSLTRNSSSATANALKNITSNRNLYAAYKATARYYMVSYYNGNVIEETVQGVQYHGDASYSGETPISDDGQFVGWMPSGKYIAGNTGAKAQFYDDTEITDSWEEIGKACEDGSYIEKYKPGNWKMVSVGGYGNVKMRIKGFQMHYGNGMKKVPISWEADTKLNQNMRMNPKAVVVETEETEAAFHLSDFTDNPSSYITVYTYGSNENAIGSNNVASATFLLKVKRDTRLRIYGVPLAWDWNNVEIDTLSWHVDLTKDGTAVATDYIVSNRTSLIGQAYDLTGGNTHEITVNVYRDLTSDGLPDSSVFGLRFTIDNNYSSDATKNYIYGDPCVEITLTSGKVDGVSGIEEGTGTLGGFAASELHSTLQESVKPLLPDELRKIMKQVRLRSASGKNVEGYPYTGIVQDTCVTDLFIPSSDEIVGANEGMPEGADFNVMKYQYRNKGNSAEENEYWCRESSNGGSGAYWKNNINHAATITGHDTVDGSAQKSLEEVDKLLPVYICFCT